VILAEAKRLNLRQLRSMSTVGLAEANNNKAGSFPLSSPRPEPRHSAPPVMQQSTVSIQEEVIWDDSMMEVDDFADVSVTKETEESVLEIQPEEKPVLAGRPILV
jgi:hypothetical protein